MQHQRALIAARRLSTAARRYHATGRASSILAYSRQDRFLSSGSKAKDHSKDVKITEKQNNGEEHVFKTETKKLLDIVANSLYTEREIFVRELVSNASDAIEKYNYLQQSGEIVSDAESDASADRSICITLDEKSQTFALQDGGIGMTLAELHENLGTIAKSGSKTFRDNLQNKASTNEKGAGIIGQFGVGFYSSFMVGSNVEVFTRSAAKPSVAYKWVSEGLGKYSVSEVEDTSSVQIGTKIVIHLKENAKEFLREDRVEKIIKQYSNFVTHSITLNGRKVNTLEPVWLRNASDVTPEQHNEFYRFISGSWDQPQYVLAYSADAPLQVKSVLYVPEHHGEMMGMQREKSGISLYCRKVMIQQKAKNILPDWLRFVKGVVDSEDLPLNLSRELLQDSALITRLRGILTKRVLKWLNDEAKRDETKYLKWYESFSMFLKEGYCTCEDTYKDGLASLLRFPTSKSETPISLAQYIANMKENQKSIYYLQAPNRGIADDSPFMEQFRENDAEVLYMHNTVDDFVVQHLTRHKEKNVLSLEKGRNDFGDETEDDATKNENDSRNTSLLPKAEWPQFEQWVRDTMKETIAKVNVSNKVPSGVPAILVDHETPAMRNLMRQMAPGGSGNLPLMPHNLEINAKHPIIVGIDAIRKSDAGKAQTILEQIVDNAVISAGLMEDPRSMVKRLNKLLEEMVTKQKQIKEL